MPTLGKELEYKKPGSLKDFKLGKKSAHCTGKQKESLSVSDWALSGQKIVFSEYCEPLADPHAVWSSNLYL